MQNPVFFLISLAATTGLAYNMVLRLDDGGLNLLIFNGFFGLILIELVTRTTQRNRKSESGPALDMTYSALIWLWVPMEIGVLLWVEHRLDSLHTSPLHFALAAFTMGIVSGMGAIVVAHELMHRRGRMQPFLADVLMGAVCYTHFCVEHVYGHHVRVATREDPATARVGESLYRFYLRVLPGSLLSAWSLEARRLERQGLPAWRLRNRVYLLPLSAFAFGLIAWELGGVAALIFFVAQSLVGVLLLEAVNYLEHYGLTRQRDAAGRYEAVGPQHAWNSGHILTNWLLYNLGRHSDHHVHARRHYQELNTLIDAPQLPAGYPAMIFLALLPPLWFRVLDRRLRVLSSVGGADDIAATSG